MLDPNVFADDPQDTLARLATRGAQGVVPTSLQHLVAQRRSAIASQQAQREALNQASAEVAAHARRGDAAAIEAARTALRTLKGRIQKGDEALAALEAELQAALLEVPNLPAPEVPVGADAASNVCVAQWGTPRQFDFVPKAHWDLVEALGLVDFAQAGKLSGARFAVYRGAGARLERALSTFMLDMARKAGFVEVAPPLLVRPQAMQSSGQYPKFRGEAFETQDGDYALIPTSEVPLVNLHADEVLDAEALPKRYTAYTPCFRREAGAAGKDTRGLIRLHQFNKVELVALTTPEDSAQMLRTICRQAALVLEALQLPHQIMALCTGDMGFAAAQTFDLEVWLPGQSAYREISSCSNCHDFQARRARIRYRPSATDAKRAKPRLVHTLNGSGLAVGRTFVAVVENYQQADGSIRVPDVLVPYFGATQITSADS